MPRFTTISPTSVPRQKKDAWHRFRDGRYVAIGWLYDRDLTGIAASKIVDLIRSESYEDYDKQDGVRSFPQFLKLKTGDLVAVKNVNHGLFGIGEIASGYRYEPRKHFTGKKGFYYPHFREVNWLRTTYLPSSEIHFKNEKSWEPYGTVGQSFPEAPAYIINALGEKRPKLETDATLVEDLTEIKTSNRDATTKAVLASARLGQGKFRADVLCLWNHRCAVSGSSTLEVIRASHIRPWRDSTDEQRLDPHNGLPLIASLDALFDSGLISFDASGKLIVSSQLNSAERQILGIGRQSLAKKPSARTRQYLAHHRADCFLK